MGPMTRAGHDDDVTMTAVATQSDWNRTLLTPLRAPAWRAYLYFVLVSILAIAGVVFIFFAGLGSGLLMCRRSSPSSTCRRHRRTIAVCSRW